MSYIDQFKRSNILLIRRYEGASAHAPLSTMSDADRKSQMRRVGRAQKWEDLLLQDRQQIEAAEAARHRAKAPLRLAQEQKRTE